MTSLGFSAGVAPAIIGTLVLGDRARPGLAWMAIAGFAIAVAAALALARFGDVSQRREQFSSSPTVSLESFHISMAATDS